MDQVLDSSLISRSLNYHGQQLKKSWETERGEGDLEKLNVDNVDFALFQERQKHLNFQDRSKRLKLHQFIAKNANVLFDEVLNVKNSPAKPPSSPSSGDLCAVLPPYDIFVPDMDKKERIDHFLTCLRPGDLIIGSLITKLSTGYLMKVFCSNGETCRVVIDIGIKAIIHSVNMIPAVDKKNVTRSFLLNDLVCCEVLEVVVSTEKIYAGMKGEHCAPAFKSKLGLMHSEDLPPAFKKCQEGVSGSYDEMLTTSVGFQNPGNVKYLSEELGLGSQQYSNFPALRFGFPTEESAAELRQAQSAKWAFRSVADGIAHFKAGRHTEAFQCLNKALTIDAANIEALVARGALYANGGSFKKAIEDFESALKTNGNHQNARKYLAETLVAYGRSFEDEGKFEEAISSYEKCLAINPYHEEAKNSIEYIKTKQGKVEPETIPLLTPGKTQGVRDTLKHLLAQQQEGSKSGKKKKKKEKKSKHKKNRSRSSSSSSSSSTSSSSSSSSSSSDSSSASSQDSHHKKKHKRKSEHKDKSLSPISKKLALMDSQAAIEGLDGLTKLSHHYNPPANPYMLPIQHDPMGSADLARNLAMPPKTAAENDYELRVKKFLEQTRGDDDYEEKVRKFLEETVKWKKDRKGQEEKKKKKKKDKKLTKKDRKKKKSKKMKKAEKDDKIRRGKRRRSASNVDDDEYGSKTDLSRLLLPDSSIPDLEDLQSKLSAYYARVDKAPKKRERDLSEDHHSAALQGLMKAQKMSLSPQPSKSSQYEALEKAQEREREREREREKEREREREAAIQLPPPRKGKRQAMDMFEESADSSPDKDKHVLIDSPPLPPVQKFKMTMGTGTNKLKKEKEHSLSETWEELEEKGSSFKDEAPPPPPPTKDEMAQNLKKIVEKKKESAVDAVKNSVQQGPSVMDKLGGFRINPAAVPSSTSYHKEDEGEHKRKSRTAESDSESDGGKDKEDSASSRSRSPASRPRKKYSGSESSEGSYKGRSRSKSGSYSRSRRYRSSESGSYSRSYSRSRSRSRSYRSRSRSDERNYRNKYPGRYPRNRGTYYRPRFQNNGNFKNRGYNRGGYRNNRGGYNNYRDYGNRDYRSRGGFRGRGRGRGPRYYNHGGNRRDYRDYNRRYDRGGSRSEDDDSPMRKVDAAKEKIDKMISQEHTGPLSEGEERDEDFGGKWNKEDGSSPVAEK